MMLHTAIPLFLFGLFASATSDCCPRQYGLCQDGGYPDDGDSYCGVGGDAMCDRLGCECVGGCHLEGTKRGITGLNAREDMSPSPPLDNDIPPLDESDDDMIPHQPRYRSKWEDKPADSDELPLMNLEAYFSNEDRSYRSKMMSPDTDDSWKRDPSMDAVYGKLAARDNEPGKRRRGTAPPEDRSYGPEMMSPDTDEAWKRDPSMDAVYGKLAARDNGPGKRNMMLQRIVEKLRKLEEKNKEV